MSTEEKKSLVGVRYQETVQGLSVDWKSRKPVNF